MNVVSADDGHIRALDRYSSIRDQNAEGLKTNNPSVPLIVVHGAAEKKIMGFVKISPIAAIILTMSCSKTGSQTWSRVARDPEAWYYFAAEKAEVRQYPTKTSITDPELLLSNVKLLRYRDLDEPSFHTVVAVAKDSRAAIVNGTVEEAALPEFRGKVLSAVVDYKLRFYFLDNAGGVWTATNSFDTRVVAITYSRTNDP